MKKYEDVAKQLDEKIPRDLVATRSNGNFSLSYLEGWHVIDRLNQVFGNLKWSYDIEELKLVNEGKNAKGAFTASYIARVRLTVPNFKDTPKEEAMYYGSGTTYEDVGFGNGMDRYDAGKPHELATKEAVTDGLKRCAKNLGMSMGLALYDKTQENVDDGTKTKSTPKPKDVRANPVLTGNKSKGTADPKATIGLINSTFRAVEAKRVKLEPDPKAYAKAYIQKNFKVNKVAELNATQATEFLTHLQTLIA